MQNKNHHVIPCKYAHSVKDKKIDIKKIIKKRQFCKFFQIHKVY